MKASIIIPAHNEEKCIGSAITAAMAQDYPDFEVIVVDNASADKTSEYAKAFAVRVVREERKGTQYARECGRLAASGAILAYLDADCIPDNDWLKKGVRSFSNPKVVAVTGPYDYFDSSQAFRGVSLMIQKSFYFVVHSTLQFFHKGAILIGGNMFIRAEALEKIGGLDTSILFYGDDTDTAKRLSAVGTVVFDRQLVVKSMSRRFAGQGIWRTMADYTINFFSTTFFGKSSVVKHEDFR